MYIIHYNSIYVSTVAVLYPNQMKHTSLLTLLILPLTSEILPSECVCASPSDLLAPTKETPRNDRGVKYDSYEAGPQLQSTVSTVRHSHQ